MSNSRTEIILEFNGKEVTEEQKADITALKYIDNDELHIDDLQITTRNRDILSGVSEIKLALKETGQNRTDTSRIMGCLFHKGSSSNSFSLISGITKIIPAGNTKY